MKLPAQKEQVDDKIILMSGFFQFNLDDRIYWACEGKDRYNEMDDEAIVLG